MFAASCKAEGEGGRGGKYNLIWNGSSEITFVYIFILCVCCPSPSWLLYLRQGEEWVVSISTRGWHKACYILWEFYRVLLYLRARLKKGSYCLRGKQGGLPQLNACRSLFHSVQQIPETGSVWEVEQFCRWKGL